MRYADTRRMLNHASGPAGMIPSDPFTTFIEQAIAVLRSHVDRMQPGTNGASPPLELGDLLLSMGQYVQRLGRDDTSLRLKSRFCLLTEAVLSRPEDVTIPHEVKFRHLVLEWIAEWSIDVSRASAKKSHASRKLMSPCRTPRRIRSCSKRMARLNELSTPLA